MKVCLENIRKTRAEYWTQTRDDNPESQSPCANWKFRNTNLHRKKEIQKLWQHIMHYSCSFVTKSAHRISRESFNQESPNFTMTSSPTYSSFVTSLTASCRKLSRKKNCRQYHLRRLLVEFVENGLSKDYEILLAYRAQVAFETHRIWLHQLIPVGISRNSINGRKWRLRRLWVEL